MISAEDLAEAIYGAMALFVVAFSLYTLFGN